MSNEQWALGLRPTKDLRQTTTEGFASPTTDNKGWLPELRKHGSTAEQKKEFVYIAEKSYLCKVFKYYQYL